MKWYLARFVYQIVCGEGNHTPQFDEQWRLILADEIGWAREKAEILGHLNVFEGLSAQPENVCWKFIGVTDICEMPRLEDGAEVICQTTEPEDATAYLRMMKTRAQFMKDEMARFAP